MPRITTVHEARFPGRPLGSHAWQVCEFQLFSRPPPAHAKPACLRVVTYNQWRVADHAIPAHNRKQFVKNYEKN